MSVYDEIALRYIDNDKEAVSFMMADFIKGYDVGYILIKDGVKWVCFYAEMDLHSLSFNISGYYMNYRFRKVTI